MTVEALLARLDRVKARGSGRYSALCPGHADRSPSLSITEGTEGVLLRCWAGCSLENIVAALNLEVRDLFYDSAMPGHERRTVASKPKPFDWRKFAGEIENDALDCFLRGEAVLKSATGVDISGWTDTELDDAMEAVAGAHMDLARCEALENLAFNIRAGGLKREREKS